MSNSAQVIGSINVAELLGNKRIRIKPKGYHFIDDIADAEGLSYSHVGRKLQQAHRKGKVERMFVFVEGKYRAAYKVTL